MVIRLPGRPVAFRSAIPDVERSLRERKRSKQQRFHVTNGGVARIECVPVAAASLCRITATMHQAQVGSAAIFTARFT
jgi:hypothetical protein